MSSFELRLTESELKIILEALTELETKMSTICDASEDKVADVGNDFIEIRLLLKPLKEKAIAQYGENIVNLSHDLL